LILKERYRFTPSIDVVDGGTLGLDLLPVLEDHTHVLAIDAVDAGLKPGQIGQWNNDEIPSSLRAKFSVHQVGFVDLLLITKWRERNPSDICLIGIQPESLNMGLELSDRIQKRMRRLIAVIIEKLKEWKVTCVLQSP
jgi:hydrogenase maturation protease